MVYGFGRVGLLVCLLVSGITYKVMNGWAWNRGMSPVKEQFIKFWGWQGLRSGSRIQTSIRIAQRRFAVSDWLSCLFYIYFSHTQIKYVLSIHMIRKMCPCSFGCGLKLRGTRFESRSGQMFCHQKFKMHKPYSKTLLKGLEYALVSVVQCNVLRFTLNSLTRVNEFREFLSPFWTNFHDVLHTLFIL